MADNRNSIASRGFERSNGLNGGCCGNGSGNGNNGVGGVIIDTYQVFDSCRDRDCFEDTRVFLDEMGQNIIEHTGQVRTKSAEICSSTISVEPVQLSRGFYRVTVRFYVRLELEACMCPGKAQCFTGLAVVEKSVVLYGGEGSVHIFRSGEAGDSFCSAPCCGEHSSNLPTAVVETVDPVVLGTRIVEPHSGCCNCCCSCCDIPGAVASQFGGLTDEGERYLSVSLGFFSVIRIERPGQFLVNAAEFSVPDKECMPAETSSPCDAFRRMAFPTEEFAPGRAAVQHNYTGSSGCGDRDSDRDNGCGCRK